ncbi:MAG: hypothetical protein ACOYYS_03650 [Chloroflexota bacterium]
MISTASFSYPTTSAMQPKAEQFMAAAATRTMQATGPCAQCKDAPGASQSPSTHSPQENDGVRTWKAILF